MTEPTQLDSLLDTLEALAEAPGEVSLRQVLRALGPRSFGPLMVAAAGLLILPVGMIPGVPGAVAAMLGLIGVHLFVARAQIWVPKWLARRSVSSRLLGASARRARPWAHRLRPLLATRATGLVEGALSVRAMGLILVATGAVMFVIGFIPGLPFALAGHVLLFGLGLTARDGVLVALGYVAVLAEIGLIVTLLGWLT
ncbi:hypothetical protein ACMU_12685 [Actibacterium mucosum KCTC 23349]|uniref:Exopolysaccharide biosynthesis protein exod n=1 Tax=Actibacterium mucosum KCTC 23349 TaxID=1454373 RepID=A0A037ZHD0_9RHOB|nr:exopolysaccharide biosynthesis protein [Actibacterium mucosum]KAJ55543.1 hypothetical protein ACMU_12685 [Actibacterium mucosum KCTC 23349]